eukprot:XP_019074830.1 PREDICTED: heparanase-like protein 3 [Vitis vinifera]
MGCVLTFVGLCLWVCLMSQSSIPVASQRSGGSGNVEEGSVFINGRVAIGSTDDDFICATLDWWPPDKCDYGTCSWGRASLLNLPNSLFILTKFNNYWAVVIFGLNALSGRTIGLDGLAAGAWNSSDAESLIRYSANKGYTIHGWELGNELTGNGVGAGVPADQYASDINTLQSMVQKIYAGFEVKPLVLGPGGFFDASCFHFWYIGVDDHLIDKILDPSYLDGGSKPFQDLQSILQTSATSATAWVGEAGGAYNSGHNLVTNAFAFSFWYLDQLGMASSYDTKTYCRQTLIGGNYGLLNTTTFVPNPDYYRLFFNSKLRLNIVIPDIIVDVVILQCTSLAPFDGKKCSINQLLWDKENTCLRSLFQTIRK